MSRQLILNNESISDIVTIPKQHLVEMVTENELINVPVHSSINIDEITAGDPDPKFVNVEVMRARTSGNGNRYNNNSVREVNDLIPGVQAFLGHPDPSKFGFEFREPQGIYVGSVIDQLDGGILRSIAKCYLFTTSPLREWVPKSIAAGNPMTVSINGSADVIRNNGYTDVIHITGLDSIDWANPGTEGMDTSQALSVVREQQQNNNTGGSDMDIKDVISNVSVVEMRAYNPNACADIIKAVTLTELQANNPKLIDEIKESGKITEMQLNINGKQETVKLSELQATISGYEAKITELQASANAIKLESYKEKKIGEQVPEKLREQISKRVSGKTEAEIDASLTSEIAYVREMGGWDNLPAGSQRRVDATETQQLKDTVYNIFGNKPKQ